ncbi:hypothetical protein BSG1_16400 [Bacillus sp. SG-1]|nr:hypothetical protein BSG1_16400 [Bacillus sp. SG-1]
MGADPRLLELDLPPRMRLNKKWKRPVQPRQANVPQRKKRGSFLLFAEGYLTPRGWVLELDVPLSRRRSRPFSYN